MTLDLDDLDADVMAGLGAREDADAFLRLEGHYVPRVDSAALAAQEDLAVLGGRCAGGRLAWIPNAVEVPTEVHEQPRRDLLFVGSLNYGPNIDAVMWLCTEIMPLLPGVSLTVAGSRPTPGILELRGRPGIEVAANPRRLDSPYAGCRVVVAPLRLGGGTPLKVIEAMAHGRAVVTTPHAARGIPPELLSIGYEAQGFAGACRALLDDADLRQRRGAAGRDFVAAERSMSAVGELIERWGSSILTA